MPRHTPQQAVEILTPAMLARHRKPILCSPVELT
jgi:hypothetical protein